MEIIKMGPFRKILLLLLFLSAATTPQSHDPTEPDVSLADRNGREFYREILSSPSLVSTIGESTFADCERLIDRDYTEPVTQSAKLDGVRRELGLLLSLKGLNLDVRGEEPLELARKTVAVYSSYFPKEVLWLGATQGLISSTDPDACLYLPAYYSALGCPPGKIDAPLRQFRSPLKPARSEKPPSK